MLGINTGTALGVEINEQRLLLAEMKKKGDTWLLQKVVQAAIPSEVMSDGKVNQVDTLAELLKETLRSAKIRSKTTHLVVPSQYVVIRQLQLPDLPKKQLSKVIDFELQNSIHLPFEDPIYDFVKLGKVNREQPLEDGEESDVDECEVTLIASSQSAIDPVVEAAKRAGLKPVSVDIRALALERAYRRFAETDDQRTILFVDVAESSTDLHIFSGETLKFTRNIPMLLEQYKIEEERIKPFDVLEILEYFQENTNFRSYTEDLSYEIERSVNFFRYTLNNRDEALSEIVLTGLMPKSGIFAAYLQERLPDMKVSVMPFAGLELSEHVQESDFDPYEFAIPVGLALKEVK
ncbi:MAG: type IV pilus biogenesis protein PilM [Tumebacillaceae bacterium]